MAIEQQITADADLTAEPTVYSKVAAKEEVWRFRLRFDALHTDASEITITVSIGGFVLDGASVVFEKGAGKTTCQWTSAPQLVPSGETVAITVLSDNAEDDEVDVTTDPYHDQVDVCYINGDLTDGTGATRPTLELAQLRCVCDVANEGALHTYNANASGAGVRCEGANLGLYAIGNIAAYFNASNVGLQISGVTADVRLNSSGTIVSAAGTLLSATTVAGKTPAEAGDEMALTGDYDAAKTAAQAGDEMDLVDAPNSTALAAAATAVESEITDRLPSAEKLTQLEAAIGAAKIAADLSAILGTTLTETQAGQIMAAFKKFLDVALPE